MAGYINGVQIFPYDNIWNRMITDMPVLSQSSRYLYSIGGTSGYLIPNFGNGSVGMPITIVNSSQPFVSVTFNQYGTQSDTGPYPIPSNAGIEQGNSDHHVLVLDIANNKLYELWAASLNNDGVSWTAGSGAIYDLTSNSLRPLNWTSADAAGLPITPGLLRYDEVASGAINHALRCVAPLTQNTFVWPARHQSGTADPTLPPMGLRIRLKAAFNISGFSAANQVILKCLQQYGMMVADNGGGSNGTVGSGLSLSGVPDSRWNTTDLNALRSILVNTANFECVDVSSLQVNGSSAQYYVPQVKGSGSFADLTRYKTQICKVFSPSGTFLGVWNDAPLLKGFKEAINAGISSLTVTLPRKFDNYDQPYFPNSSGTVAIGNIVQFWIFGPGLPQTGKLRYAGVIDDIEPGNDGKNKETVDVVITPYSSILGDRGTIGAITFGTAGQPATYVDPVTMFTYWFANNDPSTGRPYTYPCVLDPTNPTSSGFPVPYSFQAQTLQRTFDTVRYMLPANWFYRFNHDKTVTLNMSPTTPQHIFYLGQHMASVKYAQDTRALLNDVFVQGHGNVFARKTGSDVATYGQRLLLKSDTRIKDNSTASAIAQGLLNIYDVVALRAPIRIFDYRGDAFPGLGYDIESIQPGDTMEIIDTTGYNFATTWDNFVWDEAGWDFTPGALFNQVVVIHEVDYQWDYVDLQVGAPAPNHTKALREAIREFQDYTMLNA